jgi:hypothetical protein
MHHSVRSQLRSFRHVVVVTVVALAAVLLAAGPAAADTVPFTGQGTDNGSCANNFQGPPPPPGGTQTWQFNLTGTAGGATMSATFSDGTTVTNRPEDQHQGNVSMWFIVTNAGATVVNASATRPESDGNPQFVVSHCTAGGELPPPNGNGPPPNGNGTTTTTTPGQQVTPPPGAPARIVVGAAPFTG